MKKIRIFIIPLILSAALLAGCAEGQDGQDSPPENPAAAFEQQGGKDKGQPADLSKAQSLELKDGEVIDITKAGVYRVSGTASGCTVKINAPDKAAVTIVLDGADVTNKDSAVIYAVKAGSVTVTSKGENSLSVTGEYKADGKTSVDAAIFAKSDLILNGEGSLKINSAEGNGISCKDNLSVTGGAYDITAAKDGFEAKKSMNISGGSFTVASKSAFSCKDDDDGAVGEIYISGGKFALNVSNNGIRGTTTVCIDGGDFDITAAEGIEATCVRINGGTISINASDDGINASKKSTVPDLEVMVEINGGDITIVMGPGDTDGIDANGSIYVNGGTVRVTGNSTFDYDKTGELNGGTVYVNGKQVTELPQSMFGPGGWGGGFPNGFPDGDFKPDGNFPDNFQNDFPEDFKKGSFPDGFPDGDFKKDKFPEGNSGRKNKSDKNFKGGSPSEPNGQEISAAPSDN